MNPKNKILAATVLVASFFLIQAESDETLVLKTPQDKANYATGVGIVRKLKQQGGEVNLDIVIQGMRDGLTDYRLLMSEDEMAAGSLRIAERISNRQQADAVRSDEEAARLETPKAAPNSGQGSGSPAPATREQRGAQEQSIEQLAGFVPEGTMLSRRNRAKLNISQVKTEMRAKALSGSAPRND